MKSAVAVMVLGLAASAQARVLLQVNTQACTQSASQIQALQTQTSQTQAQASACAAGGEIEPYNPTWAPWPTHAWPNADTNTCTTMQNHATYIQQNNAAQIQAIQADMNQQGC